MASNFANVDSLAMGLLLDIIFTKGVRDQLPQNFKEFELIKSIRVDRTEREARSKIQTGRGPSRVQAASPGVANGAFPRKSPAVIQELTAKLKEYDATTSIGIELFERLRGTGAKAADELAIEMAATMTDIKRRHCIDLFNDGSGIVVRLSGAGVETKDSGTSTNVQTVLCTAQKIGTVATMASPGSITFLEVDDILIGSAANGNGTRITLVGTSMAGFKVVSVDLEAGTFVLQPVDLDGTFVADCTDSNLDDGVMLHRIGDTSALARTDTVADWGSASNYLVGLESLTATDGRTVHGIPMTGAFKGTRVDGSAAIIDLPMIQKVISKCKRACGEGVYKWDSLLMSYASFDAFVDSRESDRRLISVDDTTRGTKKFAYQHGNDSLVFYVSEFCPENRAFAIPVGGKEGKVLEMHMKDAQHLKTPDGASWHLDVSGGVHVKNYLAYHMMFSQLVCNHPAAIGVLCNFVNS